MDEDGGVGAAAAVGDDDDNNGAFDDATGVPFPEERASCGYSQKRGRSRNPEYR